MAAGRGVEDGGAARGVGAAVSLHRVVLGVGHAEDGNVCLGREGGEGSGQRAVESRRGTLRKKRGVLSTAFGACILVTVFLHPGSGLIQGLDKVRDTRARVRRGDGRKPRVTSMTACRVRRFSLVTRALVAIRRFGW